uniref:Gastrin/cholecystokinin peptide hormone domain-containing protein n=1 Tax=Salarias fasciatus TaxID=181472 RepID=A0A672G3F7_SALFA
MRLRARLMALELEKLLLLRATATDMMDGDGWMDGGGGGGVRLPEEAAEFYSSPGEGRGVWSSASNACGMQFAGMSVKVMVVCLLLVALAMPGSSAAGDAKETDVLQQLARQRGKPREAADRPKTKPWAPAGARPARRAPLSEDEREIMTKQIMQAITEMMNSDCMLDRDYQGWVDFGRRDTD